MMAKRYDGWCNKVTRDLWLTIDQGDFSQEVESAVEMGLDYDGTVAELAQDIERQFEESYQNVYCAAREGLIPLDSFLGLSDFPPSISFTEIAEQLILMYGYENQLKSSSTRNSKKASASKSKASTSKKAASKASQSRKAKAAPKKAPSKAKKAPARSKEAKR